MKNKFIVFTLCFTLIFSSLNFKKSYADMGVISGPMLGVVSTLAVASGIVLNNSDDIVEFGNMFYQKNKENWEEFNNIFNSCVSIGANKIVTVGKEFLSKVFDFFDTVDISPTNSVGTGEYLGLFELGKQYNFDAFIDHNGGKFLLNGVYAYSNSNAYPVYISCSSSRYTIYIEYYDEINDKYTTLYKVDANNSTNLKKSYFSINYIEPSTVSGFSRYALSVFNGNSTVTTKVVLSNKAYVKKFTAQGVYDNTLVNDNLNSDGSVGVYVPGSVDSLIGVGSSDVVVGSGTFNPPYDLPVDGVVSVPNVSNPSIGVNGDVAFPSVSSPSVPNEGIWSAIKDFIIGLVVPNDAYWTDTWSGLYNNFTSSFPMVDMDGFNDLVTGEKKFPNIDINIMGTTGRVVNGDVINSIVDWLRPIIAGFMMLCLMLFNYRKIYKLIRNSEPFGSVASGTSDFSTGISEYSKQDVVKATDMVAEYRAWRERGGK